MQNPKPPLKGEVARRSRVGGVAAESFEYAGNNKHFPASNLQPLSQLSLTAPLKGSLELAYSLSFFRLWFR